MLRSTFRQCLLQTIILFYKNKKINAQKHLLDNVYLIETIGGGPISHRSAIFHHSSNCTRRGSNPSLYRGRVLFYHQTTSAVCFTFHGFINFGVFSVLKLVFSLNDYLGQCFTLILVVWLVTTQKYFWQMIS